MRLYLRSMRNSSAIDPLLSRTTQGLLAATLLQPERWWYLSDLARHLVRRTSSLQRPLAGLVQAGILCRRKDGNRVYYRADPQCPFLGELQGILAKTVGLVDVLRETLAPLQERIAVAFVYGSVAASRERADSDVDLMVIGDLGLADLTPTLDEAERRLARPVNAHVIGPREFAERVAVGDHFLCAVLDKERLFVVGNTDELDRITGRKPR